MSTLKTGQLPNLISVTLNTTKNTYNRLPFTAKSLMAGCSKGTHPLNDTPSFENVIVINAHDAPISISP